MNRLRAWAVLGLVLVSGCARLPVREPTQAMRPFQRPLPVVEERERESLRQALEEQIQFWQKSENGSGELVFGPVRVSRQEYLQALQELVVVVKSGADDQALNEYLATHFQWLEVYGGDRWGEVLVTSYYEPNLEGAEKPQGELTQPLYSLPQDMVLVHLGEFAEALPSLSDLKGKLTEQKSGQSILRGRLLPGAKKGEPGVVVPFPSRAQIDAEGALAQQGLELCYVDPIEAFFFHIQGSGRVRLPGGRSLHLTYAGQNGHPYYPIGKELFEIIPKEEMSLQRIEAHLRSLPLNERQALMNKNPSYVFFASAPDGRGLTYQGTPVVAGRTIATDRGLFPKGALAVLQTQVPVFTEAQAIVPTQWIPFTRLVLDQDTGGAIRGGGRVDYFWGSGPEAARAAGVMKSPGRLWYLAPRRP
ncbi:MAG: MltA domain-containing protein [Bdellovibrionales bacterium]|nr:MltA domain-containing protein [Bdellovibrionales bacterium]